MPKAALSDGPRSCRRVFVRYDDRGEESIHRLVGGDALKSRPSTCRKAALEKRAHALDFSEIRDLLRCATLVTLGVLASSLVIGAYPSCSTGYGST
jgi:hypothetical protein